MNKAIFLKQIEGLLASEALFVAINTYSSNTLFTDDIFSTDELKEKATEYFFHSGDKRLSKIAQYWNEESVDLTAFLTWVCKAVVSRFGRNWIYIQGSYFLEDYNPLENYSMTEVRTPYLKETTNTQTDFKTHQEVENKVFGFNSDNAVDSGKTISDTNGARADNKQDVVVNKTGHEDTTRSGNIGTVTSQSMLTAELEVRKYDFWEMVFRDLDRILCQQVY